MSAFDRKALLAAPSRHALAMNIPFQHIDAAGIVFFARVLDYFHDAYVDWLAHLGHPLPDVLKERRWAAPLVHAEADYMAPLRFGDRATAHVTTVEVAARRIVVGYRLEVGDRVAAVGHTVHVFVDPRSMTPTEIPDDLATAMGRAPSQG